MDAKKLLFFLAVAVILVLSCGSQRSSNAALFARTFYSALPDSIGQYEIKGKLADEILLEFNRNEKLRMDFGQLGKGKEISICIIDLYSEETKSVLWTASSEVLSSSEALKIMEEAVEASRCFTGYLDFIIKKNNREDSVESSLFFNLFKFPFFRSN